MKKISIITFLSLLILLGFAVKAQDSETEKLNLPGDNLNLYAVIKLFQESETLEGFEKNLNAEDSKINNLDLDGDDKIDYIKVIDNVNGESHTIILQVAVNSKENQDVAVITVVKDAKGQVQVQLIGDEELYGKDYIIEPNYDDNQKVGETPNPGYTGNTTTVNGETVVVTKTTYVEVQSWPVVRYIYMPTYVVWHSPWYWGYYPSYWNPWRPYYWDYYYGYHSHWYHHYYGHYRHSHSYRNAYYRNNYYGHRATSITVNQRRQNGMYKNTYSRPETRQQGSSDFAKKYPDRVRPSAKPGSGNNSRPTTQPSTRPTTQPSTRPTIQPSTRPTTQPSTRPTTQPSTRPTTQPSTRPTIQPSTRPTTQPSTRPTTQPSTRPTPKPSKPATQPSSREAVSQPSRR